MLGRGRIVSGYLIAKLKIKFVRLALSFNLFERLFVRGLAQTLVLCVADTSIVHKFVIQLEFRLQLKQRVQLICGLE